MTCKGAKKSDRTTGMSWCHQQWIFGSSVAYGLPCWWLLGGFTVFNLIPDMKQLDWMWSTPKPVKLTFVLNLLIFWLPSSNVQVIFRDLDCVEISPDIACYTKSNIWFVFGSEVSLERDFRCVYWRLFFCSTLIRQQRWLKIKWCLLVWNPT